MAQAAPVVTDNLSKSENPLIYQLSDFQFENLMLAANSRSAAFVVIQANETDSPGKKEQFDKQNRDIDDLIAQGLLKDVSGQFQEPIQLAKLTNRVCRIVMITETALKLFHGSKTRSVN